MASSTGSGANSGLVFRLIKSTSEPDDVSTSIGDHNMYELMLPKLDEPKRIAFVGLITTCMLWRGHTTFDQTWSHELIEKVSANDA